LGDLRKDDAEPPAGIRFVLGDMSRCSAVPTSGQMPVKQLGAGRAHSSPPAGGSLPLTRCRRAHVFGSFTRSTADLRSAHAAAIWSACASNVSQTKMAWTTGRGTGRLRGSLIILAQPVNQAQKILPKTITVSLSHEKLWFNDEQAMLGYLDRAENGLGSRFQEARARMQAQGDTPPDPSAPHAGAWQEAATP
jgi:hypothetical protein